MDSAGCAYTVASSNYDFMASTGDIELSKFDPTGSNVWTVLYDGPFHRLDDPTALAVDAQGCAYVTGWTWNTNSLPVAGDEERPVDIVTLKYDPEGTILWSRFYHCAADLAEYARALAVDEWGNVYVVGNAVNQSPDRGENSATLLKYDSAGNRLWESVYALHPRGSAGSYFHRLGVGQRGQIVAAGYTSLRLAGQYALEFLVVGYDDLTPRLAMAGVPAPDVRQGCLVSPRWTRFEILGTTNLLNPEWQSIGIVTNWNGLAPFYDLKAGQHPMRFYKATQRATQKTGGSL